MNHCINITCAKCGHIYCVRCETPTCPECGHQYLKLPPTTSKKSFVDSRINDFLRYSFLSKLVQMFARDDGFLYSVKRIGAVIEIHLQSEDRRTFVSINFDDPEEAKHESMRTAIKTIINFKT